MSKDEIGQAPIPTHVNKTCLLLEKNNANDFESRLRKKNVFCSCMFRGLTNLIVHVNSKLNETNKINRARGSGSGWVIKRALQLLDKYKTTPYCHIFLNSFFPLETNLY